jgi:hypothetical protein
VEVLARTGLRKGEFLGLTVDAVVTIGDGQWLRTPVGKLHTDRYVPLHPRVHSLLAAAMPAGAGAAGDRSGAVHRVELTGWDSDRPHGPTWAGVGTSRGPRSAPLVADRASR